MSVEIRTGSTGFKIGWWALVVLAGVSILGNLAFVRLAATAMEVAGFFALGGMHIYALCVLRTAYRRGEPWAWWVTWVLVAVYVMTTVYAPELGPYYLGPVAVIVIAQLLTSSAFFRLRQPWGSRHRMTGRDA
jgi:hypothetical protein